MAAFGKTFRLMSPAGRVYNVDGDKVRAKHVVMIGGGHSLVYPWVPAGEVWIERMKGGRKDERFILAHEMTEILLMKVHGWKYDRAHDAANVIERTLRSGACPVVAFRGFLTRHFPRAKTKAKMAVVHALTQAFDRY